MYISGRVFTITIASIFLSLGIGIFIGTILGNDMMLNYQQENIVNNLEKEFYRLRNENRNYQEIIKNIEQKLIESNGRWEEIAKKFIQNQLKDRKITLISRKNNKEFDLIKKWVEISGARVNFVILNDKFFQISGEFEETGIKNIFAYAIAETIKRAEKNLTMEFYETQGLLSIQGPFDRITDYIMILNEGLPDQIFKTLEEYGLSIIVMDSLDNTITSVEIITMLEGLIDYENINNNPGI